MEAQEWQTTSILQSPVGSYTPQLTPVGATEAQPQATTTYDAETPSRRNAGASRRSDFGPGQDGGHADDGSPIGDVWPLAFFALAMAVVTGVKRKMNSKIEKQ